ncbi:MAG: DUF2238 domain-containing protein [bacterium]|nr:DUF2238 domain-containing protein [bacterium]
MLAVKPFSRDVWWAENIPIMGIVLFLVITYRWFRFSNISYIMMSVLVFLHTLGGHYTFELVPFDFITNLFGFTRNHFDRLAHFSVGFYAYPILEFLYRKKLIRSRTVLALFGAFTILAVAAIYEIFEWLYAVSSNPEAGAAFLGSQGDVWDAQKDMLADGLGSITAVLLFLFANRNRPDRL